eukprot:Mycagemm_TRINITY_DN10295_c2_g2::TRINITY_DN10295_c2_g2_i1::g.4089::m.4089 type:complete len:108 gc:universal TRINITY_DN10295_c2_g2_i1:450-127(-)
MTVDQIAEQCQRTVDAMVVAEVAPNVFHRHGVFFAGHEVLQEPLLELLKVDEIVLEAREGLLLLRCVILDLLLDVGSVNGIFKDVAEDSQHGAVNIRVVMRKRFHGR